MKTANEMADYTAECYFELVESQKTKIEKVILSWGAKIGLSEVEYSGIYPENIEWLVELGYTVNLKTLNIYSISW